MNDAAVAVLLALGIVAACAAWSFRSRLLAERPEAATLSVTRPLSPFPARATQ